MTTLDLSTLTPVVETVKDLDATLWTLDRCTTPHHHTLLTMAEACTQADLAWYHLFAGSDAGEDPLDAETWRTLRPLAVTLLDGHAPLWLSGFHEESPTIVSLYLWIVRQYLQQAARRKEPPFPTVLLAELLGRKVRGLRDAATTWPRVVFSETGLAIRATELASEVVALLAEHHAEPGSFLEGLREQHGDRRGEEGAATGEESPRVGGHRDVPEFDDFPSEAQANRPQNNPFVRITHEFSDAVDSSVQQRVEQAATEPFPFAGTALHDDPAAIAQVFATLSAEFPHFQELTDFLHGQTMLLKAVGFSVPPVLILGQPAIGKTHFSARFAELTGIPFAFKSMAGVSDAFVLTGLDPSWKNSKMGFIASTFLRYQVANPLIFLDEIDKISRDRRHDPEHALLELLETQTAQNFFDEHITNVALDISKVSFLATANDLEGLSEPLRSRFLVFTIPVPDREQRRRIVPILHRDLLKQLGLRETSLPTAVRDFLAEQDWDFRQVRHRLRQALGRACVRRGSPEALRVEDFDTSARRTVRMGFSL